MFLGGFFTANDTEATKILDEYIFCLGGYFSTTKCTKATKTLDGIFFAFFGLVVSFFYRKEHEGHKDFRLKYSLCFLA